MPCTHCGEPLNKAQFWGGRRLKSCPGCSKAHGSQHVFLPCPEAFGTSTRRVTGANPEGFQSHCTPCRGPKAPELAAGRLCSELPPAA